MRGAAVGLALFLALIASGGVSAGGASGDLPTLGDANCDADVAATDAAIVLQFAGAIAPSLPCMDNADVDWSESVNSVDASLVLQHVARLVPDFVRMSLVVSTDAGSCDADVCEMPAGAAFDLTVVLANNPTTGYAGVQTNIFFGDLIYEPSASMADEIAWPDSTFPLRLVRQSEGQVAHGAMSSPIPPFPLSMHAGDLVRMRMRCPEGGGLFTTALRRYTEQFTLGSGIYYPDEDIVYAAQPHGEYGGLPVADILTIDCA